jgi:septum formation protein
MQTMVQPFILASSSPRRRELLLEAGYRFTIQEPAIHEITSKHYPDMCAYDLAHANAQLKGDDVAKRFPTQWVLSADTVVLCHGRILEKPQDRHEAVDMLRWLSGQTHEVVTSVYALCLESKQARHAQVKSWVSFRVLNDSAINEYINAVYVFDKAGAYALQERGDWLVERVEGSRSNVIGLPMEVVAHWLES